MEGKLICRPKPFKKPVSPTIIYFPQDSPSLSLQKSLCSLALQKTSSTCGQFFFLKNKTILLNCVGAPLAAICLEKLIASGAREILLLGFCGSLSSKLKIGDVVSINKAYSEEGTSKHYWPRRKIFYPSSKLKKTVEGKLSSKQLPYYSETVVSTDAPYRETLSWLKQKQSKNIRTVDMETSALFALCQYHGLSSTSLMVISDELYTGTWKTGFHAPQLEEKINIYFLPFLQE